MAISARANIRDWSKGEHLGYSEWLQISQAMIDDFGRITDDIEPLHNDPEWCESNSPYGKTISYGFLTLSLLTRLINNATNNAFKGTNNSGGYPLNYGFDKIRFLSPVLVDSFVRASISLSDRQTTENGEQYRFEVNIEVEGQEKSALYAEWLSLWVDN
jgi:acyl dehydratase